MQWLRRIRGAIGVGLTWAVGWAVAGIMIGAASNLLPGLPWDAFFRVFDAPLPALAVPGFFAGLFFSSVLSVATRARSHRDSQSALSMNTISLSRFAAWGATAGVMLTAFPFVLVAVGLANREGSALGTWQIVSVIAGPFVLLSTISASVSLLLARSAARRELRESNRAAQDTAELSDHSPLALRDASAQPIAHRQTPVEDRQTPQR